MAGRITSRAVFVTCTVDDKTAKQIREASSNDMAVCSRCLTQKPRKGGGLNYDGRSFLCADCAELSSRRR